MSATDLSPDQDKNACQQRQQTSNKPDAKAGERNDSYGDKINREQKHADIFGNHVINIVKAPCRAAIFLRSE